MTLRPATRRSPTRLQDLDRRATAARSLLEAAGIQADESEPERWTIEGFSFWPATGFWRWPDGDTGGGGVRKLIQAIRKHRSDLQIAGQEAGPT